MERGILNDRRPLTHAPAPLTPGASGLPPPSSPGRSLRRYYNSADLLPAMTRRLGSKG